MADEIKIQYEAATLYARVYDGTGQVWNTSGTPAFEAWADGNVADYVVALVDQDSGEHLGDFPATIVSGEYQVIAYDGAGALSDVAVSPVGKIWWDGTSEVPPANQDDVTDAHGITDALISALTLSILSVLNIYDDSGTAKPGGVYPLAETSGSGGGVYP